MIKEETRDPRWSGRDRPLSWQAARTLYNVLEGTGVRGAAAHQTAAGIERVLRHEGVGAARRLRFSLACIEWSPLLSGRPRFWRLPVAERRVRLDRWAAATGWRGRLMTELHRRMALAR